MAHLVAMFAVLFLTCSVFADNNSPSKDREPLTKPTEVSADEYRNADDLLNLPQGTIVTLDSVRFQPGKESAALGQRCSLHLDNESYSENRTGLVYRGPLILTVSSTEAGWDSIVDIAFNPQTSRGIAYLSCARYVETPTVYKAETIGGFTKEIVNINGFVKLPPVGFK